MSPVRSYDDVMTEVYREDPTYAVEMINALLDDGEPREMLVILRQLATAFGGVPALAQAAGLNPTQLYRTLSAEGNPSLTSLDAILKAMKLRLAVLPQKPQAEPEASLIRRVRQA